VRLVKLMNSFIYKINSAEPPPTPILGASENSCSPRIGG
jgi:hypothetical protein